MKSFRVAKILSLLTAISLLFSGCVSTTHLKDMVIVEGLAIDREDGEIGITLQTLNIGQANGSQLPEGNMTLDTHRSGKTIQDAITNMSKALSKRIFFGQNKLIIVGKELAESEFSKQLDFFLRSSDSRADIAICMSDKTAGEIIKSKESDSAVPSENMLYLIDNNEDSGLSQMIIVSDLLNLYKDKTSDIYLPVLTKKDKKSTVSTAGIALFCGDRLVHITNQDETMGLVMMNGKPVDMLIGFEDSQLGQIGVRLTDVRCKKRANIDAGRVNFGVKITANMLINEVERGTEVSLDRDSHERIRALAEKRVDALLRAAFDACKNNNCDCLRIGEQLAMNDSQAYGSMCNEWKKHLQSTRLDTDVTLSVMKISDNTQME